jgi:SinI restriction endonuclease
MTVSLIEMIAAAKSEKGFLKIFDQAFSGSAQTFLPEHRVILGACYKNPDLAAPLKAKSPELVALAWLKKYRSGFDNRISQRLSNPPGTVADPIVDVIIGARLSGLSANHLAQIKDAHRLSMSAENILGLLLEEYLATLLGEYGWHCCWGEVVRHVDFCHEKGALLQIKNRSNSENSSSSRVRLNQPIEKWYRVDAKTGADQWSYFNQAYKTDRFSEAGFIDFVQQVLSQNPGALAIEADNVWQSPDFRN